MKRLIDFETLKANCRHKTAFGDCYTSTFSDYVKICNKDTCPIWNSLPDAQEAIAEAESAAVKKFLNKTLSFECKEVDCGDCPNDALLCGLNIVLRAYGVDEAIKKVQGL